MKIINNFDKYNFDMLMEAVKNDRVMLILSNRLIYVLKNMNNPIATRILQTYKKIDKDKRFKITLLDLIDKADSNDEKVLDGISFFTSSKAIELVAKDLGIELKRDEPLSDYDLTDITNKMFRTEKYFSSKGRSETTIGRIVKKLFDDEFTSSEIEDFVNMFKSLNDLNVNFELVKGQDIVKYYNEGFYSDAGSGSLHDSCMRYDRCANYINFYAINPDKISLLILKDPSETHLIIGRAIVWNLDEMDGEAANGQKFMDRIYYVQEHLKDVFIKYAVKNEWLYKKYQNMEEDAHIIDAVHDIIYHNLMVNGINSEGEYPYMDTMKYYNGNALSNNKNLFPTSDEIDKLVDTYGGTESIGIWSAYYGEYIDVENDFSNYSYCEWSDDYRNYPDCFYSEHYGVDIANDYADENMVDCGDFVLEGDAGNDTKRLKEECYYSDYYNSWIENEYRDDEMKDCDHYESVKDRFRKDDDYITLSNGESATLDYAEKNYDYDEDENEYFENGVYSEYYGKKINPENSVRVILKDGGQDYRKIDDGTYEYNAEKNKNYEI